MNPPTVTGPLVWAAICIGMAVAVIAAECALRRWQERDR